MKGAERRIRTLPKVREAHAQNDIVKDATNAHMHVTTGRAPRVRVKTHVLGAFLLLNAQLMEQESIHVIRNNEWDKRSSDLVWGC